MWAHWCSDCKNEVGIVQKLMSNYGPRGLVVVAPTQHYGYVAGGKDAPPSGRDEVYRRSFCEILCRSGAGRGSFERGEFCEVRGEHDADDGARGRAGNRANVQSRQRHLRGSGVKNRVGAADPLEEVDTIALRVPKASWIWRGGFDECDPYIDCWFRPESA